MREEIGKFHEMLTLERKVREETQTTMFRMIEDIHGKVMYELQREVKERQDNEENLLRLLEETCQRVEKSIVNAWRAIARSSCAQHQWLAIITKSLIVNTPLLNFI